MIMTIYETPVELVLRYGITAWGGGLGMLILNGVQSMQNCLEDDFTKKIR